MVKKINGFTVCVFFLCIVAGILTPFDVHSEFFRYVDKNGKVHYVDDVSRIPPEYRESLKKYEERYDNLSETERAALLEKEEKKAEERQQDLINQIRQQQEANKKRLREQKASKKLVTKVTIRGNQVLLPVKVGYGRKEVEALFVLDTGAEVTVMHKDIADRLNIRRTQKGHVKVAGGKRVKVGIVKLNYIQAGPHKKADLVAVIMSTEGQLNYSGLLGMNFLRDLEYSIDFNDEVIRWKP